MWEREEEKTGVRKKVGKRKGKEAEKEKWDGGKRDRYQKSKGKER